MCPLNIGTVYDRLGDVSWVNFDNYIRKITVVQQRKGLREL